MATKTLMTPDDLLRLPPLLPEQGHHYELSDGEVVIVGNAKFRHERVKARVTMILSVHVEKARSGLVLPESLFALGEGSAHEPDVAYASNEKINAVEDVDRLISFVPELAIEVISQSETAEYAEQKVKDYLKAGVLEVWQLFSLSRSMLIRTASGTRELTGDAILETPVLPGFRVSIAEFFA
jgi:Uma2 family endonuclease